MLRKYRDNPTPDSSAMTIEDKMLSTLKFEELKEICERRGVDVIELCRLSNLDPCHETLVPLTYYVIETAKKQKRDRDTEQQSSASSSKRQRAEPEAAVSKILWFYREWLEKIC